MPATRPRAKRACINTLLSVHSLRPTILVLLPARRHGASSGLASSFHANRPSRQQRGPQRAQTFDSNGPSVRICASAAPRIQRFERYIAPGAWATTAGGRNRRREFLPARRALFPHQQRQRADNPTSTAPSSSKPPCRPDHSPRVPLDTSCERFTTEDTEPTEEGAWINVVHPSRRPLRGVLRVRTALNPINGLPHAEERSESASQSRR